MRASNLLLAAVVFPVLFHIGLGQTKLVEDAPPLPAPKAGDIAGTITGAQKVEALTAVCRATGKTFTTASFDKKTGKFLFKALPGATTYDLKLKLTDGREIEGIDLDICDARMMELAEARRKQLGLKAEEPHKFASEDVKALQDYVKDLKDFMELRRVLYIAGHGRRATMLVELMRNREFHESGGKLVWRVELWYFDYQHGAWERTANQEIILRRERIDPAAWKKISLEYYPQLSVRLDAEGKAFGASRPSGDSAPFGDSRPFDASANGPETSSRPTDSSEKMGEITFTIPDKPDPSRGRTADTAAELKTDTHILGLDEKPPATMPTTQP